MMRPLTIAAGLLLAPLLLTAHAQQTAASPATVAAPAAASTAKLAAPAEPKAVDLKGDPAKGKELSYTCRGCHGITGYKNAYPSYHVPRIGGQSPQYIASALTEYREGNRKHPTMQAQAESFSAQDIADIAAYLSTVNAQK